MSKTEQSGRIEFGLYVMITSIFDVLKVTDVLEGTINWRGGEGVVVLVPRSPSCLMAFLLGKDRNRS